MSLTKLFKSPVDTGGGKYKNGIGECQRESRESFNQEFRGQISLLKSIPD
jgi:hypothetical protein